MKRQVGIVMLIAFCVFVPRVDAQPSAEPDATTDECDIQIKPIDSQELATDPEKTKARVIARMLLDMDRCIGMQETRIASSQQGNSQGAQAGSQSGQNASSSQATPTTQTAALEDQKTSESTNPGENSTDVENVNPDNATLSDLTRNVPTPPTSIQPNTNIFDFGSDKELVLDDYAKTLHEAYLAETDPILKEALRKELTNYLNNQRR